MYPINININDELHICPKLQKYKTPINIKSLCHNNIIPMHVCITDQLAIIFL